MQTRRWCRNRARSVGVASLIAISIVGVVPVDVRGEWNLAPLIQQPLDCLRISAVRRELDQTPPTGGILIQHRQADRGAIDAEHIAGPHALRRSCQAKPTPLPAGLQHQQLRQPTTGATHLQPCLEHPGVVHHQKISRLQLLQQIPDHPMSGSLEGLRCRGHHQQPSAVAWFGRSLGDPLLRQPVVVTAELQIPGIGHRDQSARLSGRCSINSARSLRKAAPSAP